MSKVQHEATKIKREAKKIAEVESMLERNMREAMSDKHYGCANSVLMELAVACNNYADRQKVLNRAWEKMQSTPDRWCRILKTLVLLEFLLKNGPDQILGEVSCEQNHIRKAMHLSYMDEGKDRGAAVREKAKSVMDMVQDKNLLHEEREKAKQHRLKMAGGSSSVQDGSGDGSRRQAAQSTSKLSFDDRFNELKRKQEQERANKAKALTEFDDRRKDSGDDRNHRDQARRDGRDDRSRDDSPRDRRRRDSPSPGRERRRDNSADSDRNERSRREKSNDKPSESGYALFDPSDGIAQPKQDGSAAAVDLLDFMDGPSASGPSMSSQQGDWANFGSAAPVATNLLDVGDAPPSFQANFDAAPAEPDFFPDTSFEAAGGAPSQPTLPSGGDDNDFLGESAFQSAPVFSGTPATAGAFQPGSSAGFSHQPANPFAAGPSMQPGVGFGNFSGGYPAVPGGVGMSAMPVSMAQASSVPSTAATAAMRPKEPEQVTMSPEDLAKQLCDFTLRSDDKPSLGKTGGADPFMDIPTIAAKSTQG